MSVPAPIPTKGQQGQKVLEPRPRWFFTQRARWALLTCVALILIILVSFLFPYLRALARGNFAVPEAEVRGYQEYAEIESKLRSELTPVPEHFMSKAEAGTHPLSPLVFVEFVVLAGPGKPGETPVTSTAPTSPEIKLRRAVIRLRADRLIGTLAFVAGLFFLFGLVNENQRSTWERWDRPTQQKEFGSLLSQEIERYDRICASMWKRSRFLLGGGVLAALGGIGALYYLVSNEVVAKNLADLGPLVRAGAIVLYVESFAFLLLRQHRSAIQDFKYFNGLRLRILHFLVAAQATLDKIGPEDAPSMARVLLAEDPFKGSQTGPEKGENDSSSSKMDDLLSALSKLGGGHGGGEKGPKE